MKQSIQLRLGQQLTMTPQLQQAIRLLQLSSMELGVEVQQALDSNMMLELADEDGGADAEQEHSADSEADDNGDVAEPDAEVEIEAAAEATPEAENIPDELPVDTAWDDIYDGQSSATMRDTSSNYQFAEHAGSVESLRDQILWQLNLLSLNETERAIATAIIDAINGDGYLTVGLEEIKETFEANSDTQVDMDELEAVLGQVQALDPPGIAARDLRECLLLQLEQVVDVSWLDEARQLVSEHLDLLAAHDYAQLTRRMKLGKDELRLVIDLIQSMNPRPGSHLDNPEIEYVVPDVYVRKMKGKWQVNLNGESIPQLRVNKQYANMIRRADDSAENNSLKTHLQEARWFIKSLQSRSETLLRVATSIVERQQAFLEHGEEAMKPLVLHDISESLEMHESTISRVTTRKYMHTPRGIYELKYFFSSHVSTAVGGEASSTAIRAVIKKLIAAENATKPLSDSKIAGVLADKGVNVARRTVAKYREAMAIPPSNERKRLA